MCSKLYGLYGGSDGTDWTLVALFHTNRAAERYMNASIVPVASRMGDSQFDYRSLLANFDEAVVEETDVPVVPLDPTFF